MIKLPKPDFEGISLEKAIRKRKSIRSYSDKPLTKKEISQLLFSAKSAPSAGATYPIDIYLLVNRAEDIEAGLYYYSDNSLEQIKKGDFGKELAGYCLGQEMIADASVVVLLVAKFERTTSAYGERGKRYVYMEAGHIGENIYLQCESLGLGTVAIGAFRDEEVDKFIGTGRCIYILPIGKIT